MLNKVIQVRPNLKDIFRISNPENFHSFLINYAIKNTIKNLNSDSSLGRILALGANHVEAENLIKFPFKEIILTGITPADHMTREVMKKDKRVSYKIENMENLSFKNSSFEFVFIKEAIHHVPRPHKAIYEILRVAKKAVIFIEPCETFAGKFLNKLGLTSQYERNQKGNKKYRDNFVYRWNNSEIIKLLNSYYLESGYKVIFSSCWMSNRYNMKYPSMVNIFNFMGWLFSFVPKNRGNYLICTILPGKDLPE